MAILFGQKDTAAKINDNLRREIRYHKQAIDCCTEKFAYLSDIKTSLAECYAKLGHYYFRNGIYDEAIDFYIKAIENNPHHLQARNQLGLIYFRQKRYELSRDCFEEIVKHVYHKHEIIHKVDALLSLGLIYSKSEKIRNFRKAYKYVIKADSLLPKYPLTEDIMKIIMQEDDIVKATHDASMQDNILEQATLKPIEQSPSITALTCSVSVSSKFKQRNTVRDTEKCEESYNSFEP